MRCWKIAVAPSLRPAKGSVKPHTWPRSVRPRSLNISTKPEMRLHLVNSTYTGTFIRALASTSSTRSRSIVPRSAASSSVPISSLTEMATMRPLMGLRGRLFTTVERNDSHSS